MSDFGLIEEIMDLARILLDVSLFESLCENKQI
jgi:hypothetical protein